MSTALSIDGKNLVPIKDVVGSSEYSRDYIAKLARDGQIVAAQIGRQWYIDAASLENFRAASVLESQVRRRHLSQERRREREVKQEVSKHFDIVAKKHHAARARALVQSVLILVVGVSTGYFMYALSHLNPTVLFVQKAQTFLLAGQELQDVLLSTASVEQASPVLSTTTVLEQAAFSAIDEVVVLGTKQGVLVLPSSATASSGMAIEQMFSDPVSVLGDVKTGGLLVLGTTTATRTVPFVVVPVDTATSEVVVAHQVEASVITP